MKYAILFKIMNELALREKGISMYKNYIFDLYGTLVDIRTDENKDLVWEKMTLYYSFFGANYEPEELKQKFHKYVEKIVEATGNSEEIEIDIEDVFFQLFRNKKVKPKKRVSKEAARIFRIMSLDKLELYPYAETLLKELKEKGKNIYLMSNAQACFTRFELKSLGIDKYFDEIYISSEHEMKKPNKEFFDFILNDKGMKAEKSVMIGNDCSTDIEGARRAGIDSVYIHSNIVNPTAAYVKPTYEIEDGDLRKILSCTVKE